MSRGYSQRWLAMAVGASAALVLAAPYIGQLRGVLRDAVGERFTVVMAAVVVGAATIGVGLAVRAITDRRAARYVMLVAAIAIAMGYAVLSSTGNAEVDAVERFHFIEYGFITFLFYRTWRPADDGALLVMPALAAVIVGICEEWLQWFVPARVGEVRDIGLNSIAVGCGLLFCLALDPPPRLSWSLHRASRRRVALLASAAVVVFGLFFQSVHLGHQIADREAGVFHSRYTADELRALSAERAERWQRNPPLAWSRLSREDQYFSEGVAHVQWRNRQWEEGNILAARHENLILEKYYAPVLDTPSYVSATGHRWADEQRARAESQPGPGFMIYDSAALPYPIYTWSPWVWWLLLCSLIGIIWRVLR